jgi:hypothetical protein
VIFKNVHREASLAGPAGQDAAFLVGSLAEANTQIVAVALTEVGAVGVQAAEDFQVVPEVFRQSQA